jgi:hypothetical protein
MRFIETRCTLLNNTLEDLGLEGTESESEMMLDLSRIESFREHVNKDDVIDPEKSIVTMYSGDSFGIFYPYQKLKIEMKR